MRISGKADIINLFPKSADKIEILVNTSIQNAKKEIEAIVSIPKEERTFANTARTLDILFSLSPLAITANVLAELEMVHPDKNIRNAAHNGIIKLQNFIVDHISNNKKLYQALQAYAATNIKQENLSDEEAYFISETLSDFKKAGLDLPDKQLEAVRTLKKELAELERRRAIQKSYNKKHGITPQSVQREVTRSITKLQEAIQKASKKSNVLAVFANVRSSFGIETIASISFFAFCILVLTSISILSADFGNKFIISALPEILIFALLM